MSENKRTPEQEDMEVLEGYLKQFGARTCMVNAMDGMTTLARKFAACAVVGLDYDDIPESIKADLRRVVGKLQVSLDILELVIGDTAEEECDAIMDLAEQTYAAVDAK